MFTEERFFVLDNDGRKNSIKTSAKIRFLQKTAKIANTVTPVKAV